MNTATKPALPPLPAPDHKDENCWKATTYTSEAMAAYGATCEEHGYQRGLTAGFAMAIAMAANACDEQASEPECPERAKYCADAVRALAAHPTEQAAPAEPLQALVDQAQALDMGYGKSVQEAQAVEYPDIAAFEKLAAYQGLQDFTKAEDKSPPGEIPAASGGKFAPATYYNFITELAYRVWANKPAALASPQPVREPLPIVLTDEAATASPGVDIDAVHRRLIGGITLELDNS